jgi:predicted TIM-barrel fold metal-dependent hydrolase
MRIADAHHHLWDGYGVAEFRSDAAGVDLVASVHVEGAAGDPFGETAWLDRLADEYGCPSGIVAGVTLESPTVAEQLAWHSRYPRVRGIRQMLDRDLTTGAFEPTRLMGNAQWRAGLRLLATCGLVFDLQVLPSQLPEAVDLAADVPDLTFVLNHGGYHQPASRRHERMWQDGLARLAQLPNVVVKASGYARVDPSFAGYADFVQTLVGLFGPDRVLFGSNFPIDGEAISYPELVRRTAEALEPGHVDLIFYRNTASIYGLED